MKEKIEELREMKEIQGQDGNWNYDPYMLGLYNGLESALAILEDRNPEYRQAPEKWLKTDKWVEEEE